MRKILILLMIMGLVLVFVPSAQAEVLDFSSYVGSLINVNGTGTVPDQPTGTITFSNTTGTDFWITNSTFGLAQGDLCTLTNTNYTFQGPYSTEAGGTATVTGTGDLTIYDNYLGGGNLTATVLWEKIETNASGSYAYLNDKLLFNVTNVSYSGSNPDLLAFPNKATLSWTANGDLDTLGTNGHVDSVGYSGTFTTVPLPPDAVLFGTGLLGLVVLRRRKFFKT